MILRLSVIAATVLCVVGCNKSTPIVEETKVVTNAPSVSSGESSSGMKTTASGLKYQVMKQGGGTVSPKATDTVKVHYHGTLLNGTVFDSSVQRGEPISFPLNRVVPGWTEG